MKKHCFYLFLLTISIGFLPSCERKPKPIPNIDIVSEAIPREPKIPCVIVYSENGEITMENARVKTRGGASCVFPKVSYTFKMDHSLSLAGLPKQKSYILNANYIDKSMMHHKICFDLFREMNPLRNIAAECAYVTVSLNGSYNGLYVLMQKLNAGSLGLDKKDSLAMIFKDPPIFFGENRLDPRWVQEPGNYFQQNFPDIEDEDKNGYLEDVMQFMIHADDSTFAREIVRIFDLENIIDWHLLLMFTNNGDGVMKNFYLYKRDSHTPFRIAIWDYDDAFGRDGEGELKMTESLPNFERCLLLNRLENNPYLDYNHLLRQRYKALRDNGLFSKKKIERMIRDNDKIIKDYVERNFERWPVDGIGYYDAYRYEEEIEVMRQYLDIRIPQLDEEMGYKSR
jgi:hypothetical protein